MTQSSSHHQSPAPSQQTDNLKRARHEAWLILALWLGTSTWTATCSVLFGYAPDDTQPIVVNTIAGFPTWILFAVVIPWIVTAIFTLWFAMCYIQDEESAPLNDESSEGGSND